MSNLVVVLEVLDLLDKLVSIVIGVIAICELWAKIQDKKNHRS